MIVQRLYNVCTAENFTQSIFPQGKFLRMANCTGDMLLIGGLNVQDICPLCEPAVKGYAVEIPDEGVVAEIVTSLSQHGKGQWQQLDSGALWLETRLFFDCIPYWMEFHRPDSWFFYTAVRLDDDTVSIADRQAFDNIVAEKPALWIHDVIRNEQIKMMYQPIVSLSDKAVVGYEMLARASREDGTLIPPTTLFDAARAQSELFRLDRTCRIQGIRAGQSLEDEQLIFINFIPTSIYIPEHCLQTTMKAASQYGIAHSRVVFEVVETELVSDLEHLKRILRFYRKEGFRYALDDVGEGYNDIKMLAAMEPDVVKLDRKFVQDIHLDAEKRARAEEILKLATSMHSIALAEGIECEEEAHVLREMGYNWQQGYYYGKPNWAPQPLDESKYTA